MQSVDITRFSDSRHNITPSPQWEEWFFKYRDSDSSFWSDAGWSSSDSVLGQLPSTALISRYLDGLRQVLPLPRAQGWYDMLDTAAWALVCACRWDARAQPDISPLDRQVHGAQQYLAVIFDNPPVTIPEVARAAGFSESGLRRHWARLYGTSPLAHLNELRLEEARRLLLETNLPVKETASRCGLTDSLYLSRCFRKKFGVSPTEFGGKRH